MKAAVVTDFARSPQYTDFEPPTPQPGETLVQVRTAALSQLVRAQAAGKHWSSLHKKGTLFVAFYAERAGRPLHGCRFAQDSE